MGEQPRRRIVQQRRQDENSPEATKMITRNQKALVLRGVQVAILQDRRVSSLAEGSMRTSSSTAVRSTYHQAWRYKEDEYCKCKASAKQLAGKTREDYRPCKTKTKQPEK